MNQLAIRDKPEAQYQLERAASQAMARLEEVLRPVVEGLRVVLRHIADQFGVLVRQLKSWADQIKQCNAATLRSRQRMHANYRRRQLARKRRR